MSDPQPSDMTSAGRDPNAAGDLGGALVGTETDEFVDAR
jgi:hypothetical protein